MTQGWISNSSEFKMKTVVGEEELKKWFVLFRALFCLKKELVLQWKQ